MSIVIHSSLTDQRFDDGYVGKQAVWLGKNIVGSTGKNDSKKAWVGAQAAAIQLI